VFKIRYVPRQPRDHGSNPGRGRGLFSFPEHSDGLCCPRVCTGGHLCVRGFRSQPPALLSPSSRYPNIIRVYNHSTHHFHARFSSLPALSTQSASGARQKSGRTCCIARCNHVAPVRPSCLLIAIPSRLAHDNLCTAKGPLENRKNSVWVAHKLLTVNVLFLKENFSNLKQKRLKLLFI
jgi:hypothetical protein